MAVTTTVALWMSWMPSFLAIGNMGIDPLRTVTALNESAQSRRLRLVRNTPGVGEL